MGDIFRAFIRTLAFLRKEIFEILRQPRLVVTLVLGPFLILLIFGIGYRNQAHALRTLFVAPKDSLLAQEIPQYAKIMGSQLIYEGITDDPTAALEQLRRREVDLVVVVPPNASETIQANQQAVFTLFHHEIDPVQVNYITYFGQVYVDEVNRRIMIAITEQGQSDASKLQVDLKAAHTSASVLHSALDAGDQAATSQHRTELSQNVDAVTLAVGASLGLLNSVQQTTGPGDNTGSTAQAQAALSHLQQDTTKLNATDSKDEQVALVSKVENDLTDLETRLSEFQSISPSVIVSPFRAETKNIAPYQPKAIDFYAPAVLALLLQHLAITFAALSIVGERSSGTMELFRVSPLSAAETLVGKYISYLLFGGVIAAILSLLLVYALKVPMLGNWVNYALVVTAVLFTSLGIGFIISIISQTDSQAVQFSMIILLASVFFSGFLMSLDTLWDPVKIISWSLPTTYGSILLRDIVLRGLLPNLFLLLGLTAIGVVLFIIAWLLLRRQISVSQD